MAGRKIGMLQRTGLFGDDTKGATIRRACTADELSAAYRLVHDVFLATGFLRPEPSGLRLRLFETTSETATFIAEKNGVVVGVLSVVGDSEDLGLPADTAFKPELDRLRAQGIRLCELTNQAVAEPFRKSAVPTELMRCAIAHGMHAGFREVVAAVSPSHGGFYDLVGFRGLGTERSYSTKLHDPVIAMRMDLDRYRQPPEGLSGAARFIHHFASGGNQFLSKVADWGKLARRHFLNADLLERLFVNDRNFLAECTAEELIILERRWGREMFQLVTEIVNLGTSDSDLENLQRADAAMPKTHPIEQDPVTPLPSLPGDATRPPDFFRGIGNYFSTWQTTVGSCLHGLFRAGDKALLGDNEDISNDHDGHAAHS